MCVMIGYVIRVIHGWLPGNRLVVFQYYSFDTWKVYVRYTIDWAEDLVTLKIEIISFNPELSKLLTCYPSLSHCVVAALIASLSFSGLGSAVNSRRRQCSTTRSPSPMPSMLWSLPFPRGSCQE